MTKRLNPIKVQRELTKRSISMFSPLEFQRIFNVTKSAANFFINFHLKKGFFIKIRNGLYMLADYPANHYLIANRVYAPSYVSFDTALSFHGIIPETIYAVTSATTKITREFKADNIRFVYHKLKKEVYTGYRAIKHSDNTVLMAEPEKALADYLYFVALKKRGLYYERLDLKKIKKPKLLSYVKLFKKHKMIELVEKIYVEFRKPKRIY